MNSRIRRACWGAFIAGFFWAPLAEQGRAADRAVVASESVQIRVFNVAGVSRRDLTRAETEASRIFAEAGIELRWIEGGLDDGSLLAADSSNNNSTGAGCKVELNASEVRVRLLPRAPRGVPGGILGYSLPCARFGIHSTIYTERCKDVTWTSHTFTTLSKVLGYVIAHELGHVLLRSNEHSASGLMRAHWDDKVWMGDAVGGIRIDPDQARRMRKQISGMRPAGMEAALR